MIKHSVVCLFLFIGCIVCAQAKPNVIVILADDQGWGDLSCHGNTNLQTPNIDRLSSESAQFSNFYVSPVCSPTRAALLTGRYHVRTGVYSTSEGGERFNSDETTLADILKKEGYATGVFGKWHSGMQAPYHPNSRGFDEFYGFASGHWGNYFSPMLEHNGVIVKGNGYLTDDLTNHAISFVDNHKDSSFFLYLPFNTPHSPMQVPDEYWKAQEQQTLEMYNMKREEEDTLFTKAALAMVENIDYNVGRLITAIEEFDLTSNTIIIYLSDNGPNGVRWNGGMKGRKGSTDEGGIKSPMFIKWEGEIEAGKVHSSITSAVDLLPTILELIGSKHIASKPLDGVDMFKPLEDRIIYTNWKDACSLRSQRFRLDNDNRLFEIKNDPGQEMDVSEMFPSEYEKLLELKKDWLIEIEEIKKKSPKRPFTIGHASMTKYQLPARDAHFTGTIKRSNRWPNCSFLTEWTSEEDEIFWDVEVMEEGDYEIEMYYTCAQSDVGTTVYLQFQSEICESKIKEAFDPAMVGEDKDRYPRTESYTKDFKVLQLGQIHLKSDLGVLRLKAKNIQGESVADFRLLMLKKIN